MGLYTPSDRHYLDPDQDDLTEEQQEQYQQHLRSKRITPHRTLQEQRKKLGR